MEIGIESFLKDMQGNVTEITIVIGNERFSVKPVVILTLMLNSVVSISNKNMGVAIDQFNTLEVQKHKGSMKFFRWFRPLIGK